MSRFVVQDRAVWMLGEHRPIRLTEPVIDGFLDLFETAGASDLHAQLWQARADAAVALLIPRASATRAAA